MLATEASQRHLGCLDCIDTTHEWLLLISLHFVLNLGNTLSRDGFSRRDFACSTSL